VGLNLGLRYLAGASDPRPEELRSIEDGFATRVLWLDGLVMNPDRTPSNPNVLFWKRQPWLIDHGAALPFAHQWSSVDEEAPRERTDYRARHMGFVFQFYNLMPVLTAVENVELPLLLARVGAKPARQKALDALELVGVADRAGHVPDALSGGERQRVTIARSLVNDPAIVWADEPTGDLDSENAQEIVALMRRLNVERGLSFLIVTHDIAVGRKTDRIIRMLDGVVVEEQQLEVPHVLAGHAA
jgi:putative ABC transport system ATP-binding protein